MSKYKFKNYREILQLMNSNIQKNKIIQLKLLDKTNKNNEISKLNDDKEELIKNL